MDRGEGFKLARAVIIELVLIAAGFLFQGALGRSAAVLIVIVGSLWLLITHNSIAIPLGGASQKLIRKVRRRNLILILGAVGAVLGFVSFAGSAWIYLQVTDASSTSAAYKGEHFSSPVGNKTSDTATELTNSPVVVEIGVSPTKQLQIKNVGRVPIDDVNVFATEYQLDRDAFYRNQLVIKSFIKIGGPMYRYSRIKPMTSSKLEDLTANRLLNFSSFEQETKGKDVLPFFLKNYCLRVTFRDSRTGLKYVTYRVTGSTTNSPSFFENLEFQGISGRNPQATILANIPKIIIEHQRTLYERDAVEYQIGSR